MFRLIVYIFLATAISLVAFSSSEAQAVKTERIRTLYQDMQSYYGTFDKLSIKDKEYTSKLMHFTAEKILAYYKEIQPLSLAYSELAAEAQVLLALAKYEVGDPTLTYHGIKSAQKIHSGVLGKMDSRTGRSYGEMIDTIESQWLRKFCRAEAKVNGFADNLTWDTVSVKLLALYLDPSYRGNESQNAVSWANSFLNHELRKGFKDITLLLPLGDYRVETENIEIFPTQFSMAQDGESTIFKITPNIFFSLLFLHDVGPLYWETYPPKGSDDLKVYSDTLKPKDLNIWKGDRFVDDFDTLEFGVYEFRDSRKYKILDDYRFKRFIPEGQFIQWEVPDTTIYKIEDILLKDRETYTYRKMGLVRIIKRKPKIIWPPRKPSLITWIFEGALVGTFVYLSFNPP